MGVGNADQEGGKKLHPSSHSALGNPQWAGDRSREGSLFGASRSKNSEKP